MVISCVTWTDKRQDFHREIWSHPSPFWRGSFAMIINIGICVNHVIMYVHKIMNHACADVYTVSRRNFTSKNFHRE